MSGVIQHAFSSGTHTNLMVYGICVGIVLILAVIVWMALKRSNDKLRRPRATLADARAVYADEDFQDDMTVVPPALRGKVNG